MRYASCEADASGARLALRVHQDRAARARHHLHAMLLAAELVRDIPILRLRLGLRILATLDVAILRAATARVGADDTAGDRTTGGRDVVAAAVADLVADDSADQRAGDGARHVHVPARPAFVLRPAPASRLGDDGTHGRDVRLEDALAATTMVVVHRRRLGRVARGIHAIVRRHAAQRGDAVVHPHRGERRIAAGLEHDAAPLEPRVLARLPAIAEDHRGRGAIVEACASEIAHGLLGAEGAPLEVLVRVQDYLRE